MLLVRPAVKCLKALGIKHSHKVVHAAVINRNQAKNRFLFLAQTSKVHLILPCDFGILRDIEGRQPNCGSHNNGFRRLTRCLLEYCILLHRNMVRLFLLQGSKQHIQRAAVLLIFFLYIGKIHHVDQSFKVLFLRGCFADKIQHKGRVQSDLTPFPKRIVAGSVAGRGIFDEVINEGQHILFTVNI